MGRQPDQRRMLLCGLAGMAGISAGFQPVSAFGETDLMNDAENECMPISKQTDDIYFTYETLAAIRQSLLEVLKQHEPGDDYAHLISELETGNAPPMIFADSAYIGRWKFIRRNDELTLETQQIQADMPIRTIYAAPLEQQDGQWKVSAVHIKTVRSR